MYHDFVFFEHEVARFFFFFFDAFFELRERTRSEHELLYIVCVSLLKMSGWGKDSLVGIDTYL